MWKEYKAFALKGNIVELAIAVIIGNAFGKIVNSLVGDIVMPPLGRLVGDIDFSNLFINLSGKHYATLNAAKAAGAATLNYGMFLNNILNFVIVSFAIFFVMHQLNRFKRKQAAAAPKTKSCPYCFNDVPLKATRCGHCTSTLSDCLETAGSVDSGLNESMQ